VGGDRGRELGYNAGRGSEAAALTAILSEVIAQPPRLDCRNGRGARQIV
jgi:hypothetical protein